MTKVGRIERSGNPASPLLSFQSWRPFQKATRIHAGLHYVYPAYLMKFYKKQLKAIEKRIAEVLKECETFSMKSKILQSCPGVGPATTAMLLAELPELGQINLGEIAKLVGVAPIAKDSGKKEGKRATFAGRAMVRKVLYMAALVATRHNPRLKVFYQHLLIKGKPKKVAIIAVMRKLLVILNTMLKNNQLWQMYRETELAKVQN